MAEKSINKSFSRMCAQQPTLIYFMHAFMNVTYLLVNSNTFNMCDMKGFTVVYV